ncbi:MAG: hypothetical protein K9J24_00410 [Bacteroidales bacterium]|nr:hypothetical protein [Bacteroidales bacterium]
MKLDPKIRKYLSVIIAATVLWIFLGSLINFHQHRIWGKQLIEEVSPVIKPKDEKTLSIHFTNIEDKQEQHTYFYSVIFMALLFSIIGYLINWRKIFYPSFIQSIKISEFPNYEKFRGPPAA